MYKNICWKGNLSRRDGLAAAGKQVYCAFTVTDFWVKGVICSGLGEVLSVAIQGVVLFVMIFTMW